MKRAQNNLDIFRALNSLRSNMHRAYMSKLFCARSMDLLKTTLIMLVCSSLLGCGFKMRGALEIPEYLQTVYISPYDPYEDFQREFRQRLSKSKVRIVSSATPETTIIEISKPEVKEEVLAYSSSGTGQRFKLSYSLDYKLITSGKEKMHIQRTITRSREISKTINRMITNENEQQLVKKELLSETVNELLRQLTTRPLHKESLLDSSAIDDNPC